MFKQTFATLTAAAIALPLAMTPAAAAPFGPQIVPAVQFGPVGASDAPLATEVQYRRRYGRRAYRRGYRDGRRYKRRRNNTGAIIGGVVGGLALGAIIANSRRAHAAPRYYAPAPVYRAPRARFSAAHHGWCSHRYRSYRAYDGTFQPYHGPRKLCRSPY